MKKYLAGIICLSVLVLPIIPAQAETDTDNTEEKSLSSMLELLQSLMKQVETLKNQLAELRGEIREEIKDGLREGMSDEDVEKIQELLATDPTIYPRGLVTGYFGPLTKEAVMRLQNRHGLDATGEIDEETKRLIMEYFKEKKNGKFPPGLLRAPGIEKKILERMHEKKRDHDDDDDDEDEEEDDDDDRVEKTAEEAQAAIDGASEAIGDLTDLLAENEDHDEADSAADKLEKATEYLEYAETYLDDEKYTDAYYKAIKAEKIAKEGIDKLQD